MKTLIAVNLIVWINVFFTASQTVLIDKTVRIEHRQGTIGFLLDEIAATGGFSFSYSQDIPHDKTINLLKTEQTVGQYLDELFPFGINSVQFGNKLILMQRYREINTTFRLSGRVIDRETREPIPGVNVFIPGSDPLIGSVTNKEGFFEIKFPSYKNTIQLSCIGYQSRTLRPDKPEKVTVELSPENLELEQVVIMYYQKPKEEKINGAVSSIGALQLENMHIGDIEHALQGSASGVNVVRNSGMPGANLQVRIRGINSLINTDPVYYTDGVPIQQKSLNAVSPFDIESIEILKDGASLARYGATAGNGVVLLHTKKGDPGKTRISFDFYAGMQELWKKLDLMNKDEFTDYYHLIRPSSNLAKLLDSSIYNTDWQDVTFHKSLTEEYNLSASGGNHRSDFYISSGYYRQEAIIRNLRLDRYSFRINYNHQLKDRIQFGNNFSFSYLHFKGLKEGCFLNDYGNPILGALIMAPYKAEDDSTNIVISSPYAWMKNEISNPCRHPEIERNIRKNYAFFNSLNADVRILPNLHYITWIGVEAYLQDNKSYTYMIPVVINRIFSEYTYRISDLAFDWHNSLLYTASFSGHHKIDVMFDYEQGGNKCKWIPLIVNSYDENMNYLPDTTGSGQRSYEKLRSSTNFNYYAFAASIAYSYKDKLYINALLRRDDIGLYTIQHDFRKYSEYFPSFSLGWVFTRENFFPGNKILQYGKFRYGWGKAGNSPRINYTFFSRIMRDMDYVFALNSGKYVMYSAQCRRTNEQFYRESMHSHNVGFDLGFFHNRLFLTAEYYHSELNEGKKYGIEKPKEIIDRLNQTYLYGIYPPPLSHMVNKGFDLEVCYRQSGRTLNWNIHMNFNHFKNTILDVNESEQLVWNPGDEIEPFFANLPGEVAGSFYGYIIERLFRPDDCDERGSAINQPYTLNSVGKKIYAQWNARAGHYKFADINNDSVIDMNDRVVLGSPFPDFTFGLSCQLQWKNFDIALLIQGTYGNEIFNATRLYLYNPLGQSNWAKDVAHSYRPPVYDKTGILVDPGYINTDLHRMDWENTNRNLRVSDFYVEDGSYVRLKNIQIGYTIRPELTKKIHIQRLRIFISSQNLLTLTRYSGLDPEVGGWGVDIGVYPQPRVYMIGANVEL